MIDINEQDAELLRATFKDNDELLLLTRKRLFGLDTTKEQDDVLKATFTKALLAVMYRKILPNIGDNDSLSSVFDKWGNIERDIYGRDKGTIAQAVGAKHRVIQLTEVALKSLADPEAEQVNLGYEYNPGDELQIDLIARNQYIAHIANKIAEFKAVANTKVETDKDKQKRLVEDSSK